MEAALKASGDWESEVKYAQGVEIDTTDTSGIEEAVAAAKDADVVVFVGGLITCQETGPQCQEAEARDRSSPLPGKRIGGKYPDVGRDVGIGLPGPSSPPYIYIFCALVCAAPTLNAAGQSRVTLSLRSVRLRAALSHGRRKGA